MGSEWEKQGCHILNSWSSVATIGVYSGQVLTLSDPFKNYAKFKKKKIYGRRTGTSIGAFQHPHFGRTGTSSGRERVKSDLWV